MFLVFTAHCHVRGSPVSGKSVETRQHGEVDGELKFDYLKYCTVVPTFFSLFHPYCATCPSLSTATLTLKLSC